MNAETPAFSAGATLGVYEIREQIGSGDTGDVYRAWDGSRRREVALKILPRRLSRDDATLTRFLRTIEVLTRLDHPSIAILHGYEEIDRDRVLSMELTAGRPLSHRMANGPLEIEEAVGIIIQLAAALEYAHRHRLVHGHLDPAAMKIDDAGRVKVYDFGLTRTIEILEGTTGLEHKPTVERPALRRSQAAGLMTYQSPEQMKGKVDERTDIWASGVLLWEMLTGTNPFLRPTISETSQAVLSEDPDWSVLPVDLPPNVRRALQLSLQKRPAMRLRNAGDLVVELTIPVD